jgi:hypothetical protein
VRILWIACSRILYMSLVGRKILVVGGNGYVGSYFAARLVRQGAHVMAMSRYPLIHAGRASSTATPKTQRSTGWSATYCPLTSFSRRSTVQMQSCIQWGRCSTAQSREALPQEARAPMNKLTGTPLRPCSIICSHPSEWSICHPTRTLPSSRGTSLPSTRQNNSSSPLPTMGTVSGRASSSAQSIEGGASPSNTPSLPGARHTHIFTDL